MKFASILKVKKQNLDLCEVELLKRRNKLSALNDDLNEISKQISAHIFPKNGSTIEIRANLAILALYQNEKSNLIEKINLTKTEISHYENLYKNAYIDYEKINFLNDEEIKKNLAKIKRKEQVELDEISMQRFSFLQSEIR